MSVTEANDYQSETELLQPKLYLYNTFNFGRRNKKKGIICLYVYCMCIYVVDLYGSYGTSNLFPHNLIRTFHGKIVSNRVFYCHRNTNFLFVFVFSNHLVL